ncbi:MAG: complex I subunit 1/NuoH family protein [Phycisphaeraceae bacterium]
MNAQFIVSLWTITVVANLILLACAYLILLERKVAAWVQDRTGPNRTNFSFGVLPFKSKQFGLGQALADGLKLLIKEDYSPPHVEWKLFLLAPAMAVIPALLGWAVIPWGGFYAFPEINLPDWLGGGLIGGEATRVAAAPINIGVLYILAMSSLAVYGVVLGGYASNNKYSFLGGLRATAQMVSYEIPMGLCVLIAVLSFGTVDTFGMSLMQTGTGWAGGAWGIFLHPLLAIIFFTTILAETNRAPFDLAEAEQELVGGFHTEYSSMKWALFFLGEYMHMITGCAFFCVLFLGGWDLIPFFQEMSPVTDIASPIAGIGLVAAKMAVFFVKVAILLFIMMWIRWTLPRFRFDQLMRLAWQGLIPICIILLLVTGVLVFFDLPSWTFTLANLAVLFGAMFIAPLLPVGPPINRRIPLAGSRFSPPRPAAQG